MNNMADMNNRKIAILNLQVDDNYGGHLQRYELIRILQDMGFEVVHLKYENGKNTERVIHN